MPRLEQPKSLSALLAQVGVDGGSPQRVSNVVIDSRQVADDTVWFALPGAYRHGAEFASGAPVPPVAVVTDLDGAAILRDRSWPVLAVADPRALVGPVCAWLHDYPAASMTTVGVTGTNGKTSVTHFLGDAWRGLAVKAGVLGTLGFHIPGEPSSAQGTGFTTPEADALQSLLAGARDESVTHLAMEVSSHALALHRVDGIVFDVAVFTNLSQDHLDFHSDMDDYFNAKARLFTDGLTREAVVCVDDDWGLRLARDIEALGLPVTTYGSTQGQWRLRALGDDGAHVDAAGTAMLLPSLAPGEFTALNLIAAAAALHATGTPLSQIPAAMAPVRPVPGRMQRVDAPSQSHPRVYVDYAHSPDAVARVLRAAKPTGGRLIAVLGAGGDRDRGKRPLMGRAASAADIVVVTDDNPRHEDPAEVRRQVLDGVAAADVHDIADRREAIDVALRLARSDDVVVVLGKGAETGQQYGDEVRPFDDRVAAAESLLRWAGA